MTENVSQKQLRNLRVKTTCSKCGCERENKSNSYCRACKAEYMRRYRPRHDAKLLNLRYENERLAEQLESLKSKPGVSA